MANLFISFSLGYTVLPVARSCKSSRSTLTAQSKIKVVEGKQKKEKP